MTSSEERRQDPRFQLGIIAQMHDVDNGVESGLFEVNVVNISKRGLKVALKGLLQDSSRQMINIGYKGAESYCLAEVVWKKFEGQSMSYGFRILRWSHLSKPLAQLLMFKTRS